jgi:hypothetical protein
LIGPKSLKPILFLMTHWLWFDVNAFNTKGQKMFKSIILGAASVIVLAGCSGSSTTPTGFTSFAEIEPAATAMQSSYTDANGDVLPAVTVADAAAIPDSGSAVYNGFVSGPVTGGDLIGELTITAAFASGNTGTVTSEATNFYHENDGAYSGTLTGSGDLFQNPVPATDPQVQTTLGGTLSNGGMDYATNLTLNGYFVENGADPIGAIAGTADGTFDGDLFIGVFAAEE